MLSSSRQRTINSVLGFKYTNSRRLKWWLKDETLVPVALSITETVKNINEHALRPDIQIFKLNERKTVFRMKHPHINKKSFVVKAFFLNRIEHKLKHHRYGLDEVSNLLRAADKGINTPEVYGYGRINSMWGFVKASVIILEDLRDLSPLNKIMSEKEKDERYDVFMRTIPLFVSLYRANCNHIDVNSGAVMLCGQNLNSSVYLLDFQHVKFYEESNTEILMFEAGHFAKSCREWISAQVLEDWLNEILTGVGINNEVERKMMEERFNYYFEAKLSRKQRKTLIG